MPSQFRRDFLKLSLLASTGFFAAPPSSQAQNPKPADGAKPADLPPRPKTGRPWFVLRGPVASYLQGVTEQWLKPAPASNPAMLDMFRDRDRQPLREMVPWAGEFAGKYLTSAVEVWRLTNDPSQRAVIQDFVNQFVSQQAEDGYLGPWPKDSRLTGRAPNCGPKGGETWDAWGHYHAMLGLLSWHDDTQAPEALACARRMGDLLCTKFAEQRLVDTGSTEMNLAPIHTLCLLYRVSKEERYLQAARKICDEFAAKAPDGKPLAGDYLNAALAGKEFFQMPKPRWESLHPIMGLSELYWLTKDAKYRQAFEHIWWSIVKLDRHNNGGFSSGEQAQGNPYHLGAIETCCTIAWIALGVEMLKLTESSVVADELELSTLNSVLGLHCPNGRWVTYNTPMDGTRKASAHDIVFQARAGTPELNCCSVNGARGLGMLSAWGLLTSGESVLLNWYGPSAISARLPSGAEVTIAQETEYPKSGRVKLTVTPGAATLKFPLKLRIPHWSRKTSGSLNGEALPAITPGGYLTLDRTWKAGDVVELDFDFTPHFWTGERECGGKVSIFRGPLLLTYDRRYNDFDPNAIPGLDARSLAEKPATPPAWAPAILLLEYAAADGKKVRLCDFASAGGGGSPYVSWLVVKNAPVTEFSKDNPLRTGRT